MPRIRRKVKKETRATSQHRPGEREERQLRRGTVGGVHIRTMGDHAKQYDVMLKLLLIGDSAVGKSSILMRFCSDEYDESLQTTVGVDFHVKMMLSGETRVKVGRIMVCGRERSFRTAAAGLNPLCSHCPGNDLGHCGTRALQNPHDELLSWSPGHLPGVRCDTALFV